MIALDEDLAVIDQMLDRYPLLDHDVLNALARSARAGDRDARDKMVLHNLRLVVSIVKPYTTPQTFPDAMQEGIEGLIRAVDKYDPDHGATFSTYAIWWIKQAVRLWTFRKHRAYIPRYMHDAMNKVKMHTEDGERNPAVIAERSGLPVERVVAAQAALTLHYVSMDAPMDSMDRETTMADFIEDERDPFADIEENESTRQVVRDLLATLPPRDQQIIRMYYGFDGESLSVPEIAKRLGISRERVRQLYTRLMNRLQDWTPGTPFSVEPSAPKGMCACGCGKQIEARRGGRMRMFHSTACQVRYYRRHHKEQSA